MATTILLVRHAAHDNVGFYLAGRKPGICLGANGRAQAARLAARLRPERFDTILSSPRERTRETAEMIVQGRGGMTVSIEEALDEVDFGAWSGQDFEALGEDPQWRRWNAVRSLSRTPAGESMLDVQRRVIGVVEGVVSRHPHGAAVLVSHADVIKAAVSHILGLPIDAWPRFDIAPASVSTLVMEDWGARLVTLNEPTR